MIDSTLKQKTKNIILCVQGLIFDLVSMAESG